MKRFLEDLKSKVRKLKSKVRKTELNIIILSAYTVFFKLSAGSKLLKKIVISTYALVQICSKNSASFRPKHCKLLAVSYKLLIGSATIFLIL